MKRKEDLYQLNKRSKYLASYSYVKVYENSFFIVCNI